MGVKEQIIFPEIDYDAIDQIRGLDITITTSAATDVEAFALLVAFGMPFSTKWRPKGFDEAIGVVSEPTDESGARIKSDDDEPAGDAPEAEETPDAEAAAEPEAEPEPEAAAELEPEAAAEPETEAEPEAEASDDTDAAEPEAADAPEAEQQDAPGDGDADTTEKESTD